MAPEDTPDVVAEHTRYAHANGCAAAFQETAGSSELQPALVKVVGPDPVCLSFTTFDGQGNAVVAEDDWQWLIAHGGDPGGARADGVLQVGDADEKKIAVTLAPRKDADAERTLTVGTLVLRLPAGEWDHLLAHQGVYAD
jgi:hypothetical protein